MSKTATPSPAVPLTDLDALLDPAAAAAWLRVTVSWLNERKHHLPGIVWESQKVWRLHPRSYLKARLKHEYAG